MAEKVMRCAIYTRKSTEDGLEQEFNSLDAQYEACAAYALSQQHEGWVVVKERYDDGGFSGGNMHRPALQRLLADIASDKIDIVLLYKIDRLTRSLTDFSKIVEVMDKSGASFVSITQSFNTTTSMGRLTLNMLLSFAQFEREVTGERIRDKIAASKKKGIWMGGPIPLGYEVKERKLLVQEDEADQVRHIMRRYLDLGTVPLLVEDLKRSGLRTKVQKRVSGPHRGGCIYRRGTLYHLLSNRIYRGMIVHKGAAYPGEHQAIVEEELWDRVQALLQTNACGSARRKRHQHPSLLVGKVFDGEARAMTPSHTQHRSKRYRYYVTRPDELGGSPAWRVSAHDLEALVCQNVASRIVDDRFVPDLLADEPAEALEIARSTAKADVTAARIRSGSPQERAELIGKIVKRIDLHEGCIEIRLDGKAMADQLEIGGAPQNTELLEILVPAVRVRRGQQVRLIIPGKDKSDAALPKRNQKLIKLVADAFKARDLVMESPEKSLNKIASEQGRCRTRLGKLVRISCLAPDIVTAIVAGLQPEDLTANRLAHIDLPLAWPEQREMLGFS